ncbi:MAG: hypothetical protein V8Q79_04140 [Christensenellales bacterium]
MSISDSDYEGKFTIPTPKGIYQAAGDTNINADYAYRAQNIRTERGLLASAYGTSRAFPSLGAQIKTLTRFYRRSRPDDADVYVAAAEGAIYTSRWEQRAGSSGRRGTRATNGAASPMKRRTAGRLRTF